MLTFWSMLTWKVISGWIQWLDMQILFKFQVNRMKIEDFRDSTLVVDLWPMLAFCPKLTSKVIGGWIKWPDLQLLFKFQVGEMKIVNFRNLAFVDLLTSKTIGFFLMPNSTIWWSFVKIGWKLWHVGDRQTNRTTKSTYQYTWKIFDFASNKQ